MVEGSCLGSKWNVRFDLDVRCNVRWYSVISMISLRFKIKNIIANIIEDLLNVRFCPS